MVVHVCRPVAPHDWPFITVRCYPLNRIALRLLLRILFLDRSRVADWSLVPELISHLDVIMVESAELPFFLRRVVDCACVAIIARN